MKISPLVSVVILNYNGLGILERCLTSVFKTSYNNFEVIVVDNASTDGSVEFIKKTFGDRPNLKMVQNPKNLGFAAGNNAGVKVANGQYIALLNNDTKVERAWLKELVAVMEREPEIGVCQAKLKLVNDPKRLDCAGGLLDYYGFPSGRGDLDEDKGQYDFLSEIFHAKGAAMIIRRNVVREVGLFDPAFFYYYEEIDLCWRARLRGYKVVFVPKSVVFHAPGFSMAKQNTYIKTFHATKNHLSMLIKNYGSKNLIKYASIVTVVRTCEILLLTLQGKPLVASAKIKAIIWTLKNLRSIIHKRVRVQSLIRRVPDSKIMSSMKKTRVLCLYKRFRQLYM